MSGESNIAAVRAFVDAINAWDFDGMRDALDPDDFVFRIPFRPEGFPAEIRGRDVYVSFAEDWSKQLEGSENLHDLVLDTLAGDPDQVVAFYKSDMRMKTGEPYRNTYVGHFRLRDGRITQFDEYVDSIPLLLAAGGKVVDPPAPPGR